MLNKTTKLFIVMLLGWSSVYSQNTGVLMGLIRDAATKEALPGVNVVINSVTGTVTDINGKYTINVPVGEVKIDYRFVGYTSQTRQIKINAAEAKIINIDLSLESKLLNTVVVSAGKFEQKLEEVTVSMEVIKPTFIENTNATSVDVAMEQVPSVAVIDGQANIRGGSGYSYGAGSRVLLLVDDLPMLAADAGDVKWSFLPVENIEQIEVIKGASSALFGSSAMNGVINIRTSYPTSKPETNINWFTGWYGDTKRPELQWWGNSRQQTQGLSFSHKQQIKRLDLVVGGNVFRDEGYRQGENEERYRLNTNLRYRFKKEGLYAGINANMMFTEGGLFLLWENDSSGAYIPKGGIADSTTTISLYETTRTSIDPYFTYIGKKGSTHKLKTRYFNSNNKNNTNQQSNAAMYYAEYQYQKKFGEFLTLTGGVVEMYSDVKSELYQDHTANNFAGFAQTDLKLWKINLSLGGRIESNAIDNGDKETIPVFRSGINFNAFKHTNIRASYGEGYRYPTIAEKYVQTQVGNIVIYPNDSVQSETGWTAEIGIKQGFRLGGWEGYIDAAYFWSEYQDMMEFTFGRYGPPTPPMFGFGFQSINIGNTQITGYDLGLAGDGTIGRVPMTIFCGYTYIDPIQLDFDPAVDTLKNSANYNILKYRYKHLFKGDIEINPGKFMLGLSARYNSFMENVDAVFESEFTLPGVKHYREKHYYGDWVFDMRMGYRITEQFKLSFIVKNLFNHEYMGRPADMQPPVNYALQLQMKF
jgi:outer membrane cobalamin receptor